MLSVDEAILLERETVRRNKMMLELNKLMQESHAVCFDKLKRETSIRIHEQLAEWLEELKEYREIGTVEECKGCALEILESYNKAIDDFEQKLLEKAPRNYVGDLELGGSVSFLSANAVTKIAEQLKVGGENERSV